MPPKYRKEQDSLGNVKVPHDAWFGAQTQRAIENYPISGRTAHPSLIRAYLKIKEAAAWSNQKHKTLDKKKAKLIIEAVRNLLSLSENEWAPLFPIDPYQAGAGTSQHMNINEVIANKANAQLGNPRGTYSPIHPNDDVNRSQSTNDTFPTAMRLAVLELSQPLAQSLRQISLSFKRKSQAWMKIPKAGRTHLQDAVPMMLGQEFAGYSITLSKCAQWIESGRDGLRELGIGGSAIGTGLTVPRGFSSTIVQQLEKLTQEKLRISKNLCESMQSQSPMTYYSSMLKLSGIEITRICNDLRLMASGPMTGFAEIFLPSVQPGSSIMPGKVNPSILEMANQAWFSVMGYDQTLTYCGQAGQLELNVMMPMMAYSLLEATQVATRATQILNDRCITGLEANESRLRRYFESTPQIATALSPKLGYEKTAALVFEALDLGTTVIDLIRKKGLLTQTELDLLLDASTLTGL